MPGKVISRSPQEQHWEQEVSGVLDQKSKLAVSLPSPRSLPPGYIPVHLHFPDQQLLQSPPVETLPASTSSEGTNVEQADARGKQDVYADYSSFSRPKFH
jgi:hypothetical protein